MLSWEERENPSVDAKTAGYLVAPDKMVLLSESLEMIMVRDCPDCGQSMRELDPPVGYSRAYTCDACELSVYVPLHCQPLSKRAHQGSASGAAIGVLLAVLVLFSAWLLVNGYFAPIVAYLTHLIGL
jgi:hypothetical protein